MGGRSYKFPGVGPDMGKKGRRSHLALFLGNEVDAVRFVVEKLGGLGDMTFERDIFRRVTDEFSGTRFEERERCVMTKDEIDEWQRMMKRLGISQS